MDSWWENLKMLAFVLFALTCVLLPVILLEAWILSYEIGEKAMSIFLVSWFSYTFIGWFTRKTFWGRKIRTKVYEFLRPIFRVEIGITPLQALEIAKEEIRRLTQSWIIPSNLSPYAVVVEQFSFYIVKDQNFEVSVNAKNGRILECYALPLGKGPRRKLL